MAVTSGTRIAGKHGIERIARGAREPCEALLQWPQFRFQAIDGRVAQFKRAGHLRARPRCQCDPRNDRGQHKVAESGGQRRPDRAPQRFQ